MSARLTPAQEAFLARIRQHLHTLSVSSQFTARLAKENNWSLPFAEAVVAEYGKFLFIAREGGHPVSPSPIIDKAWHLHLLYTKDYWSDFCPNILGFNLDHAPHTGNSADSAKFADWANQTLQSYRKFFGTPNRIWRPPAPPANTKMVLGGLALFVVGIAACALASLINLGEGGFFLAALPFVLGAVLIIKAYQPPQAASDKKSDGDCGSFTSCGSSDASSYTSSESSSHGDAGGGHGGHSCGGHGCGGGH